MTTNKIGSILAGVSIVLIAMVCVIIFKSTGRVYEPRKIQSSPTFGNGRDEMILTDKPSEPIIITTSPRQSIEAGLLRNDLWYYVLINGGKKEGGYEYEVPPWKDHVKLGWKVPEYSGTRIQYHLIPEKNDGVHSALLVFTISTVK